MKASCECFGTRFDVERDSLVYGFVKGFSMWPALIPGDVLRAERIDAAGAAPGDVLVIFDEEGPPVVHRLVACTDTGKELELVTSGDRSGADPPRRIGRYAGILRVAGVLRRGRWKPVPSRSPLAEHAPQFLVDVHCRLVRKLLWPSGKG